MMQNPLSRTENVVVQKMSDEMLIYDLENNRAVCLNQTAALIWDNCDGKSNLSSIRQKVEKKLGHPIKEDMILFALDELGREELLENRESTSLNFDGLSRREAVKKIGYGSLVALPLISSIVAPHASNAQSVAACANPGGLPPGGMDTCFSDTLATCQPVCDNQCCTGMSTVSMDINGMCNQSVSGCTCSCL